MPPLSILNFLYFILLPPTPGLPYIILCTLCDKHAISIFKSITTHFFSGAELKHISGHTRHFVPKSFSPEALSPLDPIPKRHFTRPSCDWTTLNFSLIFFFYSTAPILVTSSFDL